MMFLHISVKIYPQKWDFLLEIPNVLTLADVAVLPLNSLCLTTPACLEETAISS